MNYELTFDLWAHIARLRELGLIGDRLSLSVHSSIREGFDAGVTWFVHINSKCTLCHSWAEVEAVAIQGVEAAKVLA